MAEPAPRRRRRRVVVVNDEPAIIDLYRDMLEELDYDPFDLATEAIATDRIRAAEPDAVILDLHVGRHARYGIAMALQLRDDPEFANIPIVICTANATALDGERKKLRDIGVPLLLKPFTVDEIAAVLDAPVTAESRPVIGGD